MEPARILVLDDDADLRSLLERYLSNHGYAVRTAANAAQLERLITRERFDVLVLDVAMPGEDGLAVCRRLRSQGEWTPIVMLTARGEPMDRILGLEMGADDYMAKPFEPRELLARLGALMRRARLASSRLAAEDDDGSVAVGAWRFHPDNALLSREGQLVDLKPAEAALLRALLANPNRPLGRDRLIELAHGREQAMSDRTIDVQIMRLRRLVEEDASRPRLIQTAWGIGYVYVPQGRR